MRRTAFLILFSVALLGCCALFLLHNEEAVNLSNIVKLETPGDFIVHSSERIPKENVTSMIVADGMIFLHYDATGLVNVYDTSGAFQYGIQICTLPNGSGDIAYDAGMLYCYARGNVIYKFDGTSLVDAVQFHAGNPDNIRFEQYEVLFNQQKNHEYNGEQFYLLKEQNIVTKKDAQNQFETIIILAK
jgi:hypothetical protein